MDWLHYLMNRFVCCCWTVTVCCYCNQTNRIGSDRIRPNKTNSCVFTLVRRICTCIEYSRIPVDTNTYVLLIDNLLGWFDNKKWIQWTYGWIGYFLRRVCTQQNGTLQNWTFFLSSSSSNSNLSSWYRNLTLCEAKILLSSDGWNTSITFCR